MVVVKVEFDGVETAWTRNTGMSFVADAIERTTIVVVPSLSVTSSQPVPPDASCVPASGRPRAEPADSEVLST